MPKGKGGETETERNLLEWLATALNGVSPFYISGPGDYMDFFFFSRARCLKVLARFLSPEGFSRIYLECFRLTGIIN